MVIKFFSGVSYIEQSSYKYLELIFRTKINITFSLQGITLPLSCSVLYVTIIKSV